MSAVSTAGDRQPAPDIQPNKALRRDMPLVPASSIAGRALVIVIAEIISRNSSDANMTIASAIVSSRASQRR